MIQCDQPDCFPGGVVAKVSSRDDGTMLDRALPDPHGEAVLGRRRHFCTEAGIDYKDTVYQVISYDPQATYDKIVEVDACSTTAHTKGIQADALYTESTGVGLFLPVADCIATVIHDPITGAVCLAHLGRHSTVANLANKIVKYFESKGSNAKNLKIWMGPHVFAEDYIMQYFTPQDESDWRPFVRHIQGGVMVDISGFNIQSLVRSGVMLKNIHVSNVNTANHPRYYSHSQGDITGRFAVIAYKKD
ncbi:polyphenol oxidase family protein [Candidatus Saccharibacteria bacterium]|nr:polyphenol oxidase family protein [Candidatus Saccharibacteria bacterium]